MASDALTDAERVADELEVMQAMYSQDEFAVLGARAWRLTLSGRSVAITLPEDYPSAAPPRVALLGAQRDSALRSCEVECAYAPYLSRQAEEIEVWRRHGNMSLKDFDFEGLAGVIRNEQVEKLVAVRPETVQAASRISGVNASTIVLLVARQRRQQQQQKELGVANG